MTTNNVIPFPIRPSLFSNVRTMGTAFGNIIDQSLEIEIQTDDLEEQMEELYEQADAIYKQSEAILKLMEEANE